MRQSTEPFLPNFTHFLHERGSRILSSTVGTRSRVSPRSFYRNSHIFCVKADSGIFPLLLLNAWLDSGYMLCVSPGWLLEEFPVYCTSREISDPEVESRPALRRAASQNGDVCTDDASVAFLSRISYVFPREMDSGS